MWLWSSKKREERKKLKKRERDLDLRRAVLDGDVLSVRTLLAKRNVDVNARDMNGETPLHHASYEGHAELVQVLLNASAAVDAAAGNGETALHIASATWGSEVAELLLNANATVDATDKDGRTPLHIASEKGTTGIVKLLLKAKASVDAADKDGRTPLHYAKHAEVVELLLKANATVDAADRVGSTPLHKASSAYDPLGAVRLLLKSGANPNAKDEDGMTPLPNFIRARNSGIGSKTLEILQVLVEYGSIWDTKCEEMVAAGKACNEAPALALCIQLWAQELANGLPFTEVPVEVVQRGTRSTQRYIDSLKTSRDIIFRRKICLVGPSCAGKTSFVKSIISGKPQLEHLDDRTIGIDHFPLRFKRPGAKANDMTIHEVTFWDFAGQDAYQVAHSLFFSPRTLFFVFVDLEAFAVAFLQASIMSNMKKQETQLMDEFIERTVMKWIRIILARQPDADFVFLATKEDLLQGNNMTEQLLKNIVVAQLKNVEAMTEEMRCKQKVKQSLSGECAVATAGGEPNAVFVSCMFPHSVISARTVVQDLISNSNRSFQMPDAYTQALEAIIAIRSVAKSHDITKRIDYVFAAVDTLPGKLNLEPDLCKIILQTLHDLGDVLWYEDLGVELFQDRVILDPLLLIDFIRQVINHEHKGQTIPHSDLKALPYWSGFMNKEQMKAMKQVMQKFRLVYSADEDRTMEWDSDLIVPAYWQTKTPASWLWLGDILRINPTKVRKSGEQLTVSDILGINSTKPIEGEAVRVHWEFHFEFGLPLTLFDHFVVASVSPDFTFDAGPDWIVYEEKDVSACRLMVGRDPTSLHRTIHVEAVAQEVATHSQMVELWESFERLVRAFVGVLREYPGLDVSSFAWDDKHNKIGLKRLMHLSAISSKCVKWMPPAKHLASIQKKFIRVEMQTV